MLMTPEGYTLFLPRISVARIGSELQESGPGVARLATRLAGNASYVGNLRHLQTGRTFPVFAAEADGQGYRIITRPVGSTRSAILHIRQGGEQEVPDLETRLASFGKFDNHKALGTSAKRDDLKTVPGLYVIFKDSKPVYIGESGNLQERLQKHLWGIAHLGVPRGKFTVRVTRMPGSTPESRKKLEKNMIAKFPKVKNLRRELEEFLWGDSWG